MDSQGQRFTLLAVDTPSIQSYIFGSNRLKENLGASYLVRQATENWAFEALNHAAGKNNLNDGELDRSAQIEDGDLDTEILYAGGGNFVVLFRDEAAARSFTHELSRRALTEAPGLRLDIYQEPFIWTGTGLGRAVGQLLQNMKKARGKKASSVPLMGLGVTVMCQSTALPAVAIDDGDPVSAEVLAKRRAAEREANYWLRSELPPGEGYVYPLDLDELGRSKGERSYIAVVHADGNGMGTLIRKIGEEQDNRTYIQRMRAFSKNVKSISKAAMKAVIATITKKTLQGTRLSGTRTVSDLEFVTDDNKELVLPIRPIVFGGDDTTFVCDGRIGLALAVEYLQAFEREAQQHSLDLSACAGIAIVKSRYPFARAYQLSEDLCDEAKKFRRQHFKDGGGALDWHFTSGGLYDALEHMRAREYRSGAGSLTLRPVSFRHEGGVRSWDEIERLTVAFQKEWEDKRNKAKALRDALREGPEAVARFLSIYEQELPRLAGFEQTGWHDDMCGYFDALELMDIHISLREKEAQS